MNLSLMESNATPANIVVRYFRPLFEWRTYLNLLYLILAFPLGLVYFITLVVGFAVGIPLLIIWVGALILALVFAIWWLFLIAERQLGIWLLGQHIAPMVRPAEEGETLLRQLVALFGNPVTWKGLVFLLLKFPLGIASFILALFVLTFTATAVTSPLTYWFSEINFGLWQIDTLPEAVILALIGVLLAPLWVFVVNQAAAGFGWLAKWALGLQELDSSALETE